MSCPHHILMAVLNEMNYISTMRNKTIIVINPISYRKSKFWVVNNMHSSETLYYRWTIYTNVGRTTYDVRMQRQYITFAYF